MSRNKNEVNYEDRFLKEKGVSDKQAWIFLWFGF